MADHRDLASWYAAAAAPFSTNLVFEDGAPRLRQGHASAWRETTDTLDGDALVTLLLAARGRTNDDPARILAGLPRWHFLVGVHDHGLQRVLGKGLADIHVHFEASDPLALLWLRLAHGIVEVRHLSLYSNETLAGLEGDERQLASRREDRAILERAEADRRGLSRLLGIFVGDARRQSPAQALLAERTLLLAAWQRAFDPRASDRDAVLLAIDAYLFAKNLFLRRHQQSAGEGPGLTRFRDFLDRGETISEKRTKTKPAVRRIRFERMLSLSAMSPDIRHVELRIAPQKTLQGWYDLFRLWERLFVNGAPPGLPTIRFVVHFIRKDGGRVPGTAREHGGLRSVLDRQSVVLQQFRHARPDLARHIVGIDVANFERGYPPSVFAPYLGLLRGDEGLVEGRWTSRALSCWSGLKSRDLHRQPLDQGVLGVTYHAGEDFYHPLDGLQAIGSLLDNVLRPGDRIGHGLAVGSNAGRLADSRGSAPLPVGQLLDDLVWLRQEASPHGDWSGRCQLEGDKLIDELARQIFGESPLRSTLERAQRCYFTTPDPAMAESRKPEEVLVFRRAFLEASVDAQRSFSTLDQRRMLDLAVPMLPRVQGRLARRIRDLGVVVEACPTSNFVTGAVERLTSHPLLAYRRHLDGQCAVTINTDDPGVFGTTLDTEFSLMFDAMLESGIDRTSALAHLDATRRLAFDFAFGARLPSSK